MAVVASVVITVVGMELIVVADGSVDAVVTVVVNESVTSVVVVVTADVVGSIDKY